MAIREILLHLSDDKLARSRCEAAMTLAQDHEARVTGLYVTSEPYLPGYVRAHLTEDILKQRRQQMTEVAGAVEKMFVDCATHSSVEHEWKMKEGDLRDHMDLQMPYMDMAVVSQIEPDVDPEDNPADIAADLVMSGMRPVMVIPYVGTRPTIGKQIMLAWNGGREAIRAASDAMPFLEKADKVTVFSVNPEDKNTDPGTAYCDYLKHHGINAESHYTVAEDIDVGDALLSAAFDKNIDMIVMGAYGHSRLREMALGGATRNLLEHMTVPVLMSH